jgi:uncharacterized membrane protein YoaT (DUF817 family)
MASDLAIEAGIFAWKEALCCVFPVAVLLTVFASKHLSLPGVPRYDFVLMVCLVIQGWMVLAKLETLDELKVVCVFHLIGLAFELHKVALGSWSYPEFAYAKIGGVPLYSGFMYASVASYMCQAWRRFDLTVECLPRGPWPWLLAGAVYLYFFTNHLIWDLRWILLAAVIAFYGRARVEFTITERRRWMPVWLAFVLIGFFVWVAENIGTYYGAWVYPHQAQEWHPVALNKITSWTLMIVVAFVIVAQLKAVKAEIQPKDA